MQSSRSCSSTGRAFTLVEMLVVMAIIVLLVAIALPALSHSRQAAQHAQCMSNQRQLGVALFTHFNNTGSYHFPTYYKMDAFFPTDVLLCPSDPEPDVVPEGLFANEEEYALSYALNLHYGTVGTSWEHLSNPSQKAYLFDGVNALVDPDMLAMMDSPVMSAGFSAGTFGGVAGLASTFGSSYNGELDSLDTIKLSWTTNPGGQDRVKWTHCPPGNPDNPQQQLLPPDGAAGHMQGHGGNYDSACCGLGWWSDGGATTLTDRLKAAFMQRHMGFKVGNVLMLDGHVESLPKLSEGVLTKTTSSSSGGGPGGGPPGGGPPGGGPPGGGPPGGGN